MEYHPTNEELELLRNNDIEGFKRVLTEQGCDALSLKNYNLNNETRAFFENLGKALRGTNVTSLDLTSVKIGKHAPYFAKSLKGSNLLNLNLTRCHIAKHGPAFAKGLKGTHIVSLDLDQNSLKQFAASTVTGLAKSSVTELILTCNEIKEHAIAVAQEAAKTKIKHLGLSSNEIGDNAANVVNAFQNSAVRSLDLTCNQLHTENRLSALGVAVKNANLERLSLRSNNISKDMAIHFFKALKGSTLKALNVSNNNISAFSEALLAAIRASSLNSLDLSLNHIDSKAAVIFAKGIKGSNIKHLAIKDNSLKNDMADFVKALPRSVSTLKITANNQNAAQLAKALEGSSITWIDSDASIGFLRSEHGTKIRDAILANRRQNLKADSLVAGFELGEMSKAAGARSFALPQDILKKIAGFIPNQSQNQLAVNHFLAGFKAATNPNPAADSISRKSEIANDAGNAVPSPQPAPKIPAKTKSKGLPAQVLNFVQRPSKYPNALAGVSSVLLMGILSKLMALSLVPMIGLGVIAAVGISNLVKLRNDYIRTTAAKLTGRNGISTGLRSPAFEHGKAASKSWICYFKSYASLSDWKNAAEFGAGMKMNAKKPSPNRV
ncbi:MAG: hypothetical protein AB7V32_04070 [Candidatus Berkiella sp.]